MKFSDIETFLSVVETKSFTKTAERLYLSQSTVSHQLKNLEEELGTTLFIRQKGQRNVELTPKGAEFVKIAQRWMCLWKDTQDFQASPTQTSLSIGCPHNLLTFTLPKLIKELKSDNSLTLKVFSYRSEQVYDAIERREIDIGLAFDLPRQSSNVVSEVLFREKMCLIRLRAGDGRSEPVNPRKLIPRNEIFFPWFPDYQRWHDACWDPDYSHWIEINATSLVPSFMDDKKYWMIVPISVAKQLQKQMDIEIVDLTNAPPDRTCYKLTSRYPRLCNVPALETFDRVVTRFCRRLPWEGN